MNDGGGNMGVESSRCPVVRIRQRVAHVDHMHEMRWHIFIYELLVTAAAPGEVKCQPTVTIGVFRYRLNIVVSLVICGVDAVNPLRSMPHAGLHRPAAMNVLKSRLGSD